jgi:hypothetical protein
MYNVEHIVKNNDAENTHPYGEFLFYFTAKWKINSGIYAIQ